MLRTANSGEAPFRLRTSASQQDKQILICAQPYY
jgi:hypothetical protein